MRRLLAPLVLVAFCSLVSVPQRAQAGDSDSGAANGALIGAGIGLVVGLVAYVISVSSEKTMDENKPAKSSLEGKFEFQGATTGLDSFAVELEQPPALLAASWQAQASIGTVRF